MTVYIHALREEGDLKNHDARLTAQQFLSTPSARRATGAGFPAQPGVENFYPRPPRGGRLLLCVPAGYMSGFLSTPSARRATSKSRPSIKPETFLSTPSARRATCVCEHYYSIGGISIHALREEGDAMTARAALKRRYFYPRPPRGGRRQRVAVCFPST